MEKKKTPNEIVANLILKKISSLMGLVGVPINLGSQYQTQFQLAKDSSTRDARVQ
jgi:hypothetical protein